MTVSIIGSRHIKNFDQVEKYIPIGASKIISGGAIGTDMYAKKYATMNDIPFVEILPDYKKYGKIAPLKRNDLIVEASDYVIAVWDGHSNGTKYVIDKCIKISKPVCVLVIKD